MNDQQQIYDFLGQAVDLAVQYGLDLLGAVVILLGGWVVAGWARSRVRSMLSRVPRLDDDTLKPIIASIVRYTILVFVLIAVLAQFGVQTTSIIALLGAAGLAIGLALQGTLQNIAAGIMLLFLRPFRVGEYINAEGLAGTVEEIGLFTTQLRTFDGIYVEVPNAQLSNRAISNYSRVEARRLDLIVGIAYDDDIDKAQAALLDLMVTDERVNGDPRAAGPGQEAGRQLGQTKPALLDRRLLERALRPDQGGQAAPGRGGHLDPLPTARRAPLQSGRLKSRRPTG